jgi:LysR family hydrogen peroxide-inducible transcriptional activator
MPSLQQLRYLVALADTLHFRRAAEQCNVAQPTLSTQLKQLEKRLGVQLVERTRHRVLITPLGEAIAERARGVLQDVEEIRALAKFGQEPLHGTIRVGIVPSLGSYLLPVVVPDLHDNHPQLGLYVREGLPETLLDSLDGGALDLLFQPLPVNRAEIETEPLFREPLQVVLAADHPLSHREVMTREDLRGQTLLTLEQGHRLHDQMLDLAEEYDARLSHDFEGTSLDTLRQMIAVGRGISLLPSLYVRSEVTREKLVIARPIRPKTPFRTVALAWRKGTGREDEFRQLASILKRILKARAPEVLVL